VHECEANNAAASTKCKLPESSVYDHHDKLTTEHIVRTLRLVASDAGACKGKCSCVDTEKNQKCGSYINYKNRALYSVEYDAKDFSGNKAETVKFSVLLDDDTRPTLNFRSIDRLYTQECRKSTMAMPMPVITDNVDGKSNSWGRQLTATGRVNGKTALRVSLKATKSVTKLTYTAHDFAGAFGANGKNNGVTVRKVFTVRDTLKPTITAPTYKPIECTKRKFFRITSATCSDKCDVTKDVGTCVGTSRRAVALTGKYSYFNTGTAKGCEHRHHYLYDYKGSDCVWTSSEKKFRSKHAFQNAFLKFQMAEYGNLEADDYVQIELKFTGTKDTSTGWIKTVKIHDDVLGWVWTTVYDAPGKFHFNGKKQWQSFNAIMQKNHYSVQIRVTLHSNDDYRERHILDNLEVFGSECRDWMDATAVHSQAYTYTCTDKAGHKATPVKRTLTVVDRTPPTLKIEMSYVTEKSKGSWNGKIFTHHGGHSQGPRFPERPDIHFHLRRQLLRFRQGIPLLG
jgi:hypothetical protein